MKRSAIENQIKEKITDREMVPSKASWDRLDAMLAVAEKPKSKSKWMYVAASLVGFLLLGTFYFYQNFNDNVVIKEPVVNQESPVTPELKLVPIDTSLQQKNELAVISAKTVVIAKKSIAKIDSVSPLLVETVQLVANENHQTETSSIINQKTEQKTESKKILYVNAEALLASVENSLSNPNSSTVKLNKPETNVKVNSNELLTQVDSELDLTFREKAIKTVKQNYKAVKLALSNRNSK